MHGNGPIPPGIPCFPEIQSQGRVDGPHSNDVEWVFAPDGSRWVLKREMLGVNSLLAEAIGFELSPLLGIKTPQPGLLCDPSGPLWMTTWLPHVKHWSLSDHGSVNNKADVGAMLTLDVIVGNNDRHAGNILLLPSSGTFTAYSIDLEDSWAGTPDDMVAHSDGGLPTLVANFAPMIPIDDLAPHMLQAATTCQTWAPAAIAAKIHPWCNFLREPRSSDIISGIVSRSRLAPQLVRAHIQQIRDTQ